MRYLRQNRRRIELFVEVLRIWFETEERFATVRQFSAGPPGASPAALHESATPAQSDWERVLKMDKANATAAIIAASGLFEPHWLAGRRADARRVLELFKQRLVTLSDSDKSEATVRLLSMLAMPTLKAGWPEAWRLLASKQPPDVREALEFLKPVAEVLEGADASLLNELSPEQREFAQRILDRFKVVKRYPLLAASPP
jgi:hypothetical protein